MGNQPQSTRRLQKPTRYSKNSYSLDQNSMRSRQIEKVSSNKEKVAPILLDSISQLRQPQSIFIQPSSLQMKDNIETIQRSLSNSNHLQVSRTKQQNDQKLAKLNVKNDQLRKQLIKISTQLTSKLSRKKYQERKKELQNSDNVDLDENHIKEKSIPALKRELENGYKQIDRYKKLLENLKSNDTTTNETILNEIQCKVNDIDFQIKQTSNEIQASKNIEKNQQKMLKKSDNQNVQVKQLKLEIENLKNKLKKNNKFEKKRQHSEKVTQQYMFQLQRRYRQINGQYLPEIKSYANKNFQPEPKYQKKKKELPNFKPAKWEIADALDQIKSLKQKHEEYHVKIQKAIKNKSIIKQGNDKMKQQLEESDKALETLQYKRDRYLQLVMGNIDFLMNEEEHNLELSEQQKQQGLRVIVKGSDVLDQVLFDDHSLIKSITYSNLKIVAINVWFTNKHQISVFQAIYTNGTDFFVGKKTSNVTGQMEKESLQLEEGDYIKNIMGSFSKKGAIEFLAFNSVKGKAKQFGKEIMNGLNFTCGVTARQRPICLSGCTFFDGSYWRINKLIVDVTFL